MVIVNKEKGTKIRASRLRSELRLPHFCANATSIHRVTHPLCAYCPHRRKRRPTVLIHRRAPNEHPQMELMEWTPPPIRGRDPSSCQRAENGPGHQDTNGGSHGASSRGCGYRKASFPAALGRRGHWGDRQQADRANKVPRSISPIARPVLSEWRHVEELQHWARELRKLGHEVKMMSAQFVKGFVPGNKTDAGDARAIWLAAQQGCIRAVAIKSEAQQAILSLHRMRSQLVRFRTAQINCVRGLLGEYGEVMALSRKTFQREIGGVLTRVAQRLPKLLVDTLFEQVQRIRSLDEHIAGIAERLAAVARAECRQCASSEDSRRRRSYSDCNYLGDG